MIILDRYKGKKIAVLGLARSGMAAVESLLAGGAQVVAYDDDPLSRQAALRKSIPLADFTQMDWGDVSALVLSPGIPHTLPKPHPAVEAAKRHNCPIISDISLLMRQQDQARYVGITGTNGKSTTTSLIAHIVKKSGLPCEVGGNLGQAALTLKPLGKGGYYVLELSSYQLEIMPQARVNTAILLNITPDHLERHGNLGGYAAAKNLIFQNQTREDYAIIGVDDDPCRKIFRSLQQEARQNIIPISVETDLPKGIYVKDGILIDGFFENHKTILNLREASSLPGQHNWQNAAASYAAAKSAEISQNAIVKALLDFPGLEHRQKLVGTAQGVKFINDSKATNPEAAAKALACYDNIYWILGGKPKGEDLDACLPYFSKVKSAFLIGQAAEMFYRILSPHMPVMMCGEMEAAIEAAFHAAIQDKVSNAVVLLSPACASFDQFRDFEHRGHAFHDAVQSLIAKTADQAGQRAAQ